MRVILCKRQIRLASNQCACQVNDMCRFIGNNCEAALLIQQTNPCLRYPTVMCRNVNTALINLILILFQDNVTEVRSGWIVVRKKLMPFTSA